MSPVRLLVQLVNCESWTDNFFGSMIDPILKTLLSSEVTCEKY